jgi:DNA-binding transcriptional MerR regulator
MVRIPDKKRYFRIGEASSIIGVEPYVLRYWESEFPQLKPKRADSKQRTYQKKDLETLLEIKRLLYDDGMTIEGAKRRLRKKETAKPMSDKEVLKSIKEDLHELLNIMA